MAENSKIEWCDHTMNFWIGCQEVSPACKFCYARVQNEHWKWVNGWGPDGERRLTSLSNWQKLRKWNREAEESGVRAKVFSNSLADFFDNKAHHTWRREAWHYIEQSPHLDFLILTKRPENILKMLPDPETGVKPWGDGWPNVWLGTTVEDQEHLNMRAWSLSQIPASVRFLSCEPLLGPLTFRATNRWGTIWDVLTGRVIQSDSMVASTGAFHWVICGGESGHSARPMHPDWARSLRDQCNAADVPYFLKQWGEWMPTSSVDVYCHGPERNKRQFPNSPGISWLRDGRICCQDFSVVEHQRRIRCGEAVTTRAIEVDETALSDFHRSINDPARYPDNPLGYTWMYRVGKNAAGAMLDGREWREMPA